MSSLLYGVSAADPITYLLEAIRMNATRRAQARILSAIAGVWLLSACSNDSDGIPENGNADSGLDTALATLSRDNIQSSLNYLAITWEKVRRSTATAYITVCTTTRSG
jgi:hypothetical protein